MPYNPLRYRLVVVEERDGSDSPPGPASLGEVVEVALAVPVAVVAEELGLELERMALLVADTVDEVELVPVERVAGTVAEPDKLLQRMEVLATRLDVAVLPDVLASFPCTDERIDRKVTEFVALG